MCLIVFAWRPAHALPLVVAANRDEFHERPSLALAAWDDAPDIIGGRDLQAGGTWMGIRPDGRFAALTNIRAGGQPPGRRSRGELPEQYLRSDLHPAEYLAKLAGCVDDYAGFNLLAGTAEELWHFNSQLGKPQRLDAGVYGLSNADLDTPWPKLRRARAALVAQLGAAQPESLLQLLSDDQPAADAELPSTGVPPEWERRLSSIFIASPEYGTRASTALLRWQDGTLDIRERRFGPEGMLGESAYRHPSSR
ncbi:NRDE family protein [Stutzerimonas stutzeri]|uniref:NRDE family protein n=1 Tax=Stutzerimonas sp. S1 TaxID=3030652 RepID=UPI002224BBFE|nr:NRDE family protein [Stutzerimonas sp. S1]MCW3149395.1 NRDE family protein [Stutzerimonas sp. S1]